MAGLDDTLDQFPNARIPGTGYQSLEPYQDSDYFSPGDNTEALAREVEEYFDYYRQALMPTFTRVARHWRLYLAARKDTRKAHQKWRAWVHVPYPYSGVETVVASFMDLLLAQDPPIRPEAIGPEDVEGARKIERLFDYQLRKISFPSECELFVREMAVQGIAFRKTTWIDDVRSIYINPSQEEISEFEQALQAAVEAGAPMPPDDPEEFEKWRQQVSGELGIPVGDPPVPGPTDIIHYRGAGFERVSMFAMFYDPSIGEWKKQPCIIQRAIKPRSWVMDLTGEDEDKPFDPMKVENAMSQFGEQELSTYEQQILEMMNISFQQQADPRKRNAVEVLECYMPFSKTATYRVVLNRRDCINKLKTNPYWHGEPNYVVAQNNRVPGVMPGLSELHQPERLYYEMNTLRGLRIDGVLLSIMPIFIKLREAGMVELANKLIPGMIMSASRTDAIQQLSKIDVKPSAFTEISSIKRDIDETNATFPSIRGQVTGGGTTATETERAFQNAMARTKQRLLRFEGDLSTWPRQNLFLWYQFGRPEERIRIGGDPAMDPIQSYRKKDFLQAIDMDYAFRGARTALNQDMQIQQLKDLFTIATNAGLPGFKAIEMFRDIVSLVTHGKVDRYFMSEEEMAAQAAAENENAAPEPPGGTGTAEGGAPPPPAQPGQTGGEA